MKKHILYLSTALFFGAYTVNAQTPLPNSTSIAVVEVQKEEKVEIQEEELPESVQMALNNGEYAAWDLNKAYKVIEKKSKEVKHYEVNLKNEAGEEKTLKFDPEGMPIEE